MKRMAIGLAIWLAAIAFVFTASQSIQRAHAQESLGPNPDQLPVCNRTVIYTGDVTGGFVLLTGPANKQIYICGFTFFSNGSVNLGLVYGTGAACGTGTTKMTPAFQMGTQSTIVDDTSAYQGMLPVPESNSLCLNASAEVFVQALVSFHEY
jgi:hypothetical protein